MPASGAAQPPPEGAVPEEAFLAALASLRADVRGNAQVDMTPFDGIRDWRGLREAAESHGWARAGYNHTGRAIHWILAPRGVTPVDIDDHYFVTGPSPAELSRNGLARAAASQAIRETGTDPLSDDAAESARRAHNAAIRTIRRSASAAIVSLAALITIVAVGLQASGSTPSTAGVAASVALLVLTGVFVTFTVRGLRRWRTAVKPFADGYKQVVAATINGTTTDETDPDGPAPR